MKRPLKIALLATVTDFGGAERVLLSLTKNIDTSRYEVHPILFTLPDFTDAVFFKELKKTRKKYHSILVNGHRLKYANPVANFIETFQLLTKKRFDLVHTHGYRADVLGILTAKLVRLPVVSTCHGFISNDAHLRLYNRLDRVCLRFADRVMAVSEAIKQDLVKSGIRESRITTVQNAVERNHSPAALAKNRRLRRQQYELNEKDFVVSYAGRLSPEKGIKYLLESCARLTEWGVPVKTVLLGEGPQRGELEAFADERGIRHSTVFAGFQADIEAWLPAADVFVLPSLTEGTPIALLEAMSLGIPVIASRVGGVPDVVSHGVHGFLCEAGNSQELARLLKIMYEMPFRRKEMSAEAAKLISMKYNITKWCAAIQAEYELAALSAL